MRRLLDKLLNRFCVQTIRIPNEGKWLLIVRGKVTTREVEELESIMHTLFRVDGAAVGMWCLNDRKARVKFIRIGK